MWLSCSLGVPAGLAHCRHLSTVRTHLSALVNHSIVPPDRPASAAAGLTKEVWSKYQKDKKVSNTSPSSPCTGSTRCCSGQGITWNGPQEMLKVLDHKVTSQLVESESVLTVSSLLCFSGDGKDIN